MRHLCIFTLFALPAFAAPKLAELPEQSFSLEGIVDDHRSEPFACSFGSYRLTDVSRAAGSVRARIVGKGMLVNSGYLHTDVHDNSELVYELPDDPTLIEGARLSAFCLKFSTKPQVGYFVPERP